MTRLSTVEAEIVVLAALILLRRKFSRAGERDVGIGLSLDGNAVGSSTLSCSCVGWSVWSDKGVTLGIDIDGGLDSGGSIVIVADGSRGAFFQRSFKDTVINTNRVGNESFQVIGASNPSDFILDAVLESSIELSSLGSVVPIQNSCNPPEVGYISSGRTLLSKSVELTLSRSYFIRVSKDSTEFLDE